MEILNIKQKDWLPVVTHHVKNGLRRMGYLIVDTPIVLVHRKSQVDEELCQKLGYYVIESFNNGGTIVSNPGDFMIAHFDRPQNGWYAKFVSYFVNWLKNKGLNAELVNNDILVDGYKVCGTCITTYGRVDYTGFAISVNVNLDDIKAICRKPMQKIPKGLSEFGITTEDVEQMFIDFCTEVDQDC